jgi:hypothetical protein
MRMSASSESSASSASSLTPWDELSDAVKHVFAWAVAIEQGSVVGTRSILAGMVRSEEENTPVGVLLEHFGVDRSTLFEELIRTNRPIIFPAISEPRQLTELPSLTTNATASVSEALALQSRVEPGELGIPCLFAGLLTNPRSTAARGLEGAIKEVSATTIRDNYLEYLTTTDKSSAAYREHLRSRLPSKANPTQDPLPPVTQIDDPWKALILISSGSPTASSADDGFPCLGLLTTPMTLLTVRALTSRSHVYAVETVGPEQTAQAETSATQTGTGTQTGTPTTPDPATSSVTVDFRLAASDEHAALYRRSSPVFPTAVPVRLRLAQPQAGQTCEYASVDPITSAISHLSGTIASPDDPLRLRFMINDSSSPPGDVTIGSPVVVDGAVVGIVESSALGLLRCVSASATPLFAANGLLRVTAGSIDGAGSDAVSDVDQLGFTHYVEAFADLITSQYTQPPLTIGIFGSWGSGKSFLLQHIERSIKQRHATLPKTPDVYVVRFNAWEYSATEVMWPGLVRKILSKLDEDVPWPWPQRMWTRLKWNLPREVRRVRIQLFAAALVFIVATIVAAANSRTGLAAAIGGTAVGLGFAGLLKAASNPVARWVTALFSDTEYGQQIGYMENIKHDLETLEARLHEGGDRTAPTTGRILILIDDLDRCEPAKAVEVLQAVNLLLNFNSFIVCLGIDARIITSAIEAHYDGLLSEAGASGYEYLDKIVQIPFRIPAPGTDELIAFVAEQLGEPEARSSTIGGKPVETRIAPGSAPISAAAPTPGSAPISAAAPPAVPQSSATVRSGVSANIVPGAERPASNGAEESRGAEEETFAANPSAKEVPFTNAERHAFGALAPFMRPNPRHVKRLVNVYRLVRALARSQGNTVVLESPGATIRWLMMWAQWPYCSHMMMSCYEQLLHKVKAGIFILPLGDPMLDLLGRVEQELNQELSTRLDDDLMTLRELLLIEDCAFDWTEIPEIRKYTVNFNPAIEEQVSSKIAESPS